MSRDDLADDGPTLPFGADAPGGEGAPDASRPPPPTPLAERLRPATLDEVVGQDAVLGPGTFLREAAAAGDVPSLVLYGPPGVGKTTIARALASAANGTFVALSAVTSGVKDVRAVIEAAQVRRARGSRTLLFVDEIHRFNKAQQDAFLPHVEAGTVTLLGATTENPAFALTRALLSRLRVVVLEPLGVGALERVLDRALGDGTRGVPGGPALAPEARAALLRLSDGDARRLLNVLEGAARHAVARGHAREIGLDDVREAAQRRMALYDKGGDAAYDALSAFHKSLRGSDPDAALYWMARMLEGGEDARTIVRRLVAMACEDVGLADLHATRVALEANEAVAVLGLPEAELAMVRAVVYLAAAPKSNAVVLAMGAAHAAAKATPDLPVPLHLRNAPTALAREWGHGEGYRQPHDAKNAFVAQDYLPRALSGERFYVAVEVGDEREVARRVAWWRAQRAKAANEGAPEGPP